MLHVREAGSSDDGQRVWVTVKDADAQYQRLWGQFNPSTSQVDLLLPKLEVGGAICRSPACTAGHCWQNFAATGEANFVTPTL